MTQKDIFQDINDAKQATDAALSLAKKLGATTAEVGISKQRGLSVSTRLGETETVEFNQDGAMGITVYQGQRKGSASTADLSPDALERAVKAAIDIARFTSEDDCSGLADKDLLEMSPPDLDLYHPTTVLPDEAAAFCKEAEDAAFTVDERIKNSDGASYAAYEGFRVYGNTHGQIVGYPSSRYSLSCGVIAQADDEMERDYDYTVNRQAGLLDAPALIGKKAAREVISRLGSRKLDTMKVPVVFRAQVAASLFGHLVSAVSGTSLYRKSTFLMDSLGKQVFSDIVNIHENPHIARALASSPFDREGVKTVSRDIISGGELQTYLLTSYSARKLGRQTTGHAGGIHNWRIQETHDDLQALLKTMDRGVLITELMGQGVNGVTGDYSRGAAGFWVENGEIQYPVSEITIAGNLKDMFMNVAGIGGDVDFRGGVHTGSVMISEMQIAGS